MDNAFGRASRPVVVSYRHLFPASPVDADQFYDRRVHYVFLCVGSRFRSLALSTDPEIKLWMTQEEAIKKILHRRNAQITGAIPGAGCEARGLVQSFVTVNGQTPT